MKFVERRDKYQIQTLIVILKSTTALSKLTGDISIKSVIENNFLAECLSLFLPWPSQKTEPQVLYLFFFLSNIHNMFRHCALITWYLINDWQKYWQKLAKDYKTSTLYFHFPRQLARESESRAQPHSPDRDQEKICSLHELVFAIHPCFRVKISDSDAFISFSSFFLPDHLWR